MHYPRKAIVIGIAGQIEKSHDILSPHHRPTRHPTSYNLGKAG